MREVTDITFYGCVANDKLNIVEFFTDYCEPCKEMMPTLEKIENDYTNVIIFKANALCNSDLVKTFKVTSTPTLVFYKDGEVVNITYGLKNEAQLKEEIEKYI